MPIRRLRRFPNTSLGVVLAFVILALAVVWHIDVFDLPIFSVIGIERTELGEIAIVFLMIIPAFYVDRAVAHERRQDADLHAEQLRVLRVTMRTVQDIVNNNLNQLQLLRVEADDLVPAETLAIFDAALQNTATQLTALGNMEVFAEKPMESGQGLDVDAASAPAGVIVKG